MLMIMILFFKGKKLLLVKVSLYVLVNGFFTLFEQFERYDFASMAFYHRLLLLLAGLLLFGLEANSQGKTI